MVFASGLPDRVIRTSRQFHPRDFRPLEDLPFKERLVAAGLPHLVAPDPPRRHKRDVVTGFVVHLGTLERMNIHQLQKDILVVVDDIVNGPAAEVNMLELRHLLTDYSKSTLLEPTLLLIPNLTANAIRDYDFMTEKQVESLRNQDSDPFQITTRDLLSYQLMNETNVIPLSTPEHPVKVHRPKDRRFKEGQFYNILPGSSRGFLNARIDLAYFWERITMGLLGGLALIAPMLLMVLHKDLLTTLLTVSVSVILFAAALAAFTQLKGETVLASVAAYAAVLVVFVGTNT